MNPTALITLRNKYGLTVEALSKHIGVEVKFINRFESGLELEAYEMRKLDEFFLGRIKRVTLPAISWSIHWDQPRSPVYNLSYPKEMLVRPYDDDFCKDIQRYNDSAAVAYELIFKDKINTKTVGDVCY